MRGRGSTPLDDDDALAERAIGRGPRRGAYGDVLTVWNASDESIVSPLRCQRRAVFGECVQEVGCGGATARINGHNPTWYSLLDADLCVNTMPPIIDAQGEHADGGGDSVRAVRAIERPTTREDVRVWMVRGSERVFERERDEWTV